MLPLIINDRIDIALAVDASGVHLGQSDIPCSVARKILPKGKIIGVSAHNLKEAEKAVNRLMGFDEINLLSKDDSSANSDNTNSGDGSVDMSGIADETKETSTVFDGLINKVKKINELLLNEKIVRNKLKINASIINAKIFKNIQKEYGTFHNYLKQFTQDKTIYEVNKTTSELSDKISKDLQKRGMKFVGSTIIYSYLQAIGVIYSHDENCFLFKKE